MQREDQDSIESWRRETFGPGATALDMAIRANEEMAELLRALSPSRAGSLKAAIEAADVAILLYGVAELLNVDLHAVIDVKMEENRKRRWELDGASGHGYHVRTGKE